jgi:hypothetical protein
MNTNIRLPHDDTVEAMLRVRKSQCQETDPIGEFFSDCYTFCDWLVTNVFYEAWLPPVVLRLDKLRHGRMAEYQPVDGMMLHGTIIIDPTKSSKGVHVAEWLAHEMIHHYEWVTGRATVEELDENHHTDGFQNMAMELGLSIEPGTGLHRGYVGDVWEAFLEDCPVDFSKHELPGPQEPRRRLHKWQCSTCEFSFRSRRSNVFVFCRGETDGNDHDPTMMEMVE